MQLAGLKWLLLLPRLAKCISGLAKNLQVYSLKLKCNVCCAQSFSACWKKSATSITRMLHLSHENIFNRGGSKLSKKTRKLRWPTFPYLVKMIIT